MPSTQVWIVDGRSFVSGPEPASTADELLSAGEKQRLHSFTKPQRAREFLLGRLLLRHVLQQTLHCSLQEIAVTERRGAAPYVHVNSLPVPGLSISHSHGWIACAAGENFAVGVDIESRSPQRDLQALAEMAFDSNELRWLNRQPAGTAREAAFYRLWCGKEAMFKFFHNAGLPTPVGLPVLGLIENQRNAATGFLHSAQTADYHLCSFSTSGSATPQHHRLDIQHLPGLHR